MKFENINGFLLNGVEKQKFVRQVVDLALKNKRLLKNTFAILMLCILFLLVDLTDLRKALGQLTVEWIVVLLMLSVVLVYISAFKWSLFLKSLAFKVSIWKLFCFYLIGYFINLLFPSYIGGDAIRSFYIGKKVGQYEAFTATILERYTGIIAIISLAFIFQWFSPLVTWQIKLCITLMTVVFVIMSFLVFGNGTKTILCKIPFLSSLANHIERIREGVHFVAKDARLCLKTMILSFLYHICAVINVVVAGYALGWGQIPIIDLFAVLPIILLIGALPISPSGLGIQEGAYFYFLQGIGASSGEALGIALILRAKAYILALVGWIIWLIEKESYGNGKL